MEGTTQTTINTTLNSSQDPSYVPRGSVNAILNFSQDPEDGSKPVNYMEKPPEGQPQRNFGTNVVEMTIQDIRDRESKFNLDRDAFQAMKSI